MTLSEKIAAELETLRRRDQFRILRELNYRGEMLNLSSNDYLGLAARPELREEFYRGLRDCPGAETYALAASASRLLTGNHPGYPELERLLSRLYGGRAALVFSSGYHANIGILPALSSKTDLILSDKLNHASIIDGLRLADAEFRRYPHRDYGALEELLAKYSRRYENSFIITESVFSMDGDLADLPKLVELKRKYRAFLIVDEAHAAGVFGPAGLGLAEAQGVVEEIDLIVGTFGKAFASTGAYAIMAEPVRDYLINNMRPFIFTTALPPVVVNWSRFILEKIPVLGKHREHLQRLAAKLRAGLAAKNFKTGGNSQIVPLIVGENAAAAALAEKLRRAGLLVFAIRPPTVPAGTARLRFSLTGALRESDIERILEAVER
ncbi:MAG: 8-amino-7-oxononanoate synthase [Victivallaceae bacterium]|nr:8-amino-7-oxononanoate synthase [Victivallaceae bacterium]